MADTSIARTSVNVAVGVVGALAIQFGVGSVPAHTVAAATRRG